MHEIGISTLPCPDCDGELMLQEKPRPWGKGVVYLCRNRPRCRGLCSAHPDGSPQGMPANQETRTARNKLHSRRFDPIWKAATDCYQIAETDERGRATARKRILRKARARTYRYLANKLGIEDWEKDCHIGMFDIETCRRAWTALTGVTYEQVRDWAKAVEDREAA